MAPTDLTWPFSPSSRAEASTSGTAEPGDQLSTARTAAASSGMFDPFTIACVMPVILPARRGRQQRRGRNGDQARTSFGNQATNRAQGGYAIFTFGGKDCTTIVRTMIGHASR